VLVAQTFAVSCVKIHGPRFPTPTGPMMSKSLFKIRNPPRLPSGVWEVDSSNPRSAKFYVWRDRSWNKI